MDIGNMDIVNIADYLLESNLEPLTSIDSLFRSADIPNMLQDMDTVMLKSGTKELFSTEEGGHPTRKYSSGELIWTRARAKYEPAKDISIDYYYHPNTRKPGVNILNIPYKNIENIKFISSGPLTGCTYAWFLLKESVVLLHAGVSEAVSVEGDKQERNMRKRADIMNALSFVLGDMPAMLEEILHMNNIPDKLTLDEMLYKLNRLNDNGFVLAGQIIYSDAERQVLDCGFLRVKSYVADDMLGDCLCCIAPTSKGIRISGIMSELEFVKGTRHNSIVCRFDTSGNNCMDEV